MWNPKTSTKNESGKNVSITREDEKKNLGGGTSGSSKDVTVFEKGEIIENLSGGVDSGFLSGPQLSTYESESSAIYPDESSTTADSGAQGGGRGGISGGASATTTSAQSDSSSKTGKPENKNLKLSSLESGKEYTDSGCLEDIEEQDIDNNSTSGKKSNITGGHMLLDSGVDAGLAEWFCNLSLSKNSNQPLNNLGNSEKDGNDKKTPDFNISTAGKTVIRNHKPKDAWEIYYQQNDDGDTQLHLASITGYIEVILALIRLAPHPCLLDIQNDAAQSALHLAVLTGQPKIVRILLVAGADPTVRDSNGNTPLHLACISGDLECVKALLVPIRATEIQEAKRLNFYKESSCCSRLPTSLEQRNYDGERCVHLAAQAGHIEILQHLILFGADINAREGKSGRTPLHIAIETHNELLSNFLLEDCQKLNLETVTYAGLTAYQYAVLLQNQQMQKFLEQRGAELLTPPESEDDSDFDYDDPQIYDRFGDPGYFLSSSYNGNKTINVM